MAWCKAFMTVAMAIAVVGALLPATALAEVYMVGGDALWDRRVDYDAWVSDKTFHVNDTLEFKYEAGFHNVMVVDEHYRRQFRYEAGFHNVVVVDEASYEACTLPSDAKTLASGHEYVTFGAPGKRFYFSSILDDCDSGMKLAVDVQ